MSVPASADRLGEWSEDDWGRVLAGRPDLLERLRAGDPTAFAEMLALHPDVEVESAVERH